MLSRGKDALTRRARGTFCQAELRALSVCCSFEVNLINGGSMCFCPRHIPYLKVSPLFLRCGAMVDFVSAGRPVYKVKALRLIHVDGPALFDRRVGQFAYSAGVMS